MMALPKKLLSIDIGNEQIKISHSNRNGSKISVLDSIVIPTPELSIKDGVISKKEEITAAIKNALMSHKIKEKNVVFTISSSKIITREVELPFLKPNKLEVIIKLNAEEYFPVNLEDYNLDYTITDIIESEEGKKAKVIIFAAHSGLINMYVELAKLCNLKIQSVDYSGNSVVSFIQNAKIEGTNLFLDIGAESTMVTIMSNNVVKFSRNLLFGTKNINESIMNHFEVDYEEATKISKERQLLSFDNKENTYLAKDVTDGMEQILTGVSRLVDYYSSRNKTAVEKVYLIGGGSEIYGVSDYVEKFFNLKTTLLNNIETITFKSSNQSKNMLIYLVPAIGASLSSINLLPANVKNRELESAKKRLPILLIILCIVLLAGLYYMKLSDLKAIEDNKLNVQSEIESMQDITQLIETHKVLKEKKSFRMQLEALSSSKSDELLNLIEGLEKTMPENSFIKAIISDKISLTLDVVTKDEATAAQLLVYLKSITRTTIDDIESPLFSNVFIGSVTRTDDLVEDLSYVDISINCEYFEVKEVE